ERDGGTARASEATGHAEAETNRSVGKRTHDLSGRLVAFGRYRGRGRDVLAHDIPPVHRADSTAPPGLRRDWVATTTRGRHSKPLAGSVWRDYQVRWCYFHPHLQELSEATTVREHCSRDRNSSLLPWGGGVKVLGESDRLGSRLDGAHLARPRKRGSSRSRSASPSMLNPKTAS